MTDGGAGGDGIDRAWNDPLWIGRAWDGGAGRKLFGGSVSMTAVSLGRLKLSLADLDRYPHSPQKMSSAASTPPHCSQLRMSTRSAGAAAGGVTGAGPMGCSPGTDSWRGRPACDRAGGSAAKLSLVACDNASGSLAARLPRGSTSGSAARFDTGIGAGIGTAVGAGAAMGAAAGIGTGAGAATGTTGAGGAATTGPADTTGGAGFAAGAGSAGTVPEPGLVCFGALAAVTARPHSPQNIAPAGRIVPQ